MKTLNWMIHCNSMSRTSPCHHLEAVSRKRDCFGTDNYGDFLQSKRSVVRIMNDDDDTLCCARAIVVAKAIADEDEQSEIIKHSRSPLQKQRAQKLHEEARVPIGPCGLDQIKLFEIIAGNLVLTTGLKT